ncbi:MAG TPA: maleylacetoacetate isomerase [Kofleriaceae bacterium]|nr:maleylacetoacetate isomerase [Kofleriaceae bacterium]
MKLTLHSYWRSSASHRVRIGLGLKELAYDYVAVNILEGAQGADDYRAKNPMAQVPTLEITDDHGETIRLTQSVAILEYLDERWPEQPFLPRDAYRRAQTRALVEIVNAGIQPLHNLAVLRRIKKLGGDEVAWAHDFVAAGLAAFARLAETTAGAFSVGDSPTIADIHLLPQLLAARRFKVELGSTFDRLLAIEARCLALPAFAHAVPERQPDAKV